MSVASDEAVVKDNGGRSWAIMPRRSGNRCLDPRQNHAALPEAPKLKVPLNGTHNRMFLMDFSMQRWRNKGAWTKPCMGLFFKLIVIE
jgi:hypothetical protein